MRKDVSVSCLSKPHERSSNWIPSISNIHHLESLIWKPRSNQNQQWERNTEQESYSHKMFSEVHHFTRRFLEMVQTTTGYLSATFWSLETMMPPGLQWSHLLDNFAKTGQQKDWSELSKAWLNSSWEDAQCEGEACKFGQRECQWDKARLCSVLLLCSLFMI